MNINTALFAQILVFVGLVWFTMKLMWSPITKVLGERAAKVAEGLVVTERGKNDFRQAKERVAKLSAEGRTQVAEMVANAEERAIKIVEEVKEQTSTETARTTAQARTDVKQETVHAREILREQIASLVVGGAESILRDEIDVSKHAQLLGALKQEL